MTLVYLDANVLVPSYTRTLLVMSAPLSDFTVAWSLHAESEAERHQEAGAVPISALRRRFGGDALVPQRAWSTGQGTHTPTVHGPSC